MLSNVTKQKPLSKNKADLITRRELKQKTKEIEIRLGYHELILQLLDVVVPLIAKEKQDSIRKKSELTRVGDRAKHDAERAFLLKTLDEHNWNMSATARELKMKTGNAVIQALMDLAPEEYEKAKEDGRVVPGRRRTA